MVAKAVGGSEANGGRHPAGYEAHRRMVKPGENVVFPPGTRQGHAILRVAEPPAQGGHAAHCPKHQEHEAGLDVQ